MVSFRWTTGKITRALKCIANFWKVSMDMQEGIPALKIIIQEQSGKEDGIYFIVQMTGKNLFPKLSADEAFCDKQLFNSFSEEDKERIAYAYKNKKLLPMAAPTKQPEYLYKLFSVEPERESSKKIFKIEMVKDGIPLLKRLSSDDIHTHKEMLNNFSQSDVYQLGFHTGQESMDIERES